MSRLSTTILNGIIHKNDFYRLTSNVFDLMKI